MAKPALTAAATSSNFGNKKKMYEILGEFLVDSSKVQMSNIVSIGNVGKQVSRMSLCWDNAKCGSGISFSDNDTHVFLKEQSYVFRTVIANNGFDSGVNYWEIIADPKTEN